MSAAQTPLEKSWAAPTRGVLHPAAHIAYSGSIADSRICAQERRLLPNPVFTTSTLLALLALLGACGETADSADQAEQVTIAADTANPEIATAGEAVPVGDAGAAADPVSSMPAPEPARPIPAAETAAKVPQTRPAPEPAEPRADSGTPTVAATDPSCPPEHAAMGHCIPKK